MSVYLRNPHVAPVKILPYPKRHRFTGPADDLRLAEHLAHRFTRPRTGFPSGSDACYSDFFRNPLTATADTEMVS